MLLRLDGTWVLADFGSASRAAGVVEGAAAIMHAEDDIRRATTPAYRAPEMWDLYAKESIDYRVDLWVRASVHFKARQGMGAAVGTLCARRLLITAWIFGQTAVIGSEAGQLNA